MEFIVPTTIRKNENATLPFQLFDDGKVTVVISEYNQNEKENFFKVKDIKIVNNTEFTVTCANSPEFVDKYREYITGKLKIVITTNDYKVNQLQDVLNCINFTFKIVLGCGFRIYKITNENTILEGSLAETNQQIISRREINEISSDKLDRIKSLIRKCIENENSKYKFQQDLLKFLLNTAMAQVPNTDLAGALYVSILESIFVQDKAAEIGYRLKMRLTKKLQGDCIYAKKINDLYNKRSKVYHGNSAKFGIDELIFLEEVASIAIEQFIIDPINFTPENLDKSLLDTSPK